MSMGLRHKASPHLRHTYIQISLVDGGVFGVLAVAHRPFLDEFLQ